MKSVLISIQPKWVDKILSGEKTIEVRKTRPTIEIPFKCYIYETKSKDNAIYKQYKVNDIRSGKVIGEFVCDRIQEITYTQIYNFGRYKNVCELETRLDFYALDDYLKQKNGYGWHISDLKIYDKPKALSEFYIECKEYGSDNPNCTECNYYIDGMCYEYDESDCGCSGRKPITRPPQSWCYCKGE